MSFKSWFDKQKITIKLLLAVLGVIFLVGGLWFIPVIFIIIYIANSVKIRKNLTNLTEYVETRKNLKNLKTKVLHKHGEEELYCNYSDLYEERAVRNYQSSGYSYRVAKGVWLRSGSGTSESHGELRNIDSGLLSITTERIIFSGKFKTYTYDKKRLTSFETFSDSVQIGIEGRQKTLLFTSDRPVLLAFAISGSKNLPEFSNAFYLDFKKKIVPFISEVDSTFSLNSLESFEEQCSLLIQAIELDLQDYKTYLEKKKISEIEELKSRIEKVQEKLTKISHYLTTLKKEDDSEVKVKEKFGENPIEKEITDLNNIISKEGFTSEKLEQDVAQLQESIANEEN